MDLTAATATAETSSGRGWLILAGAGLVWLVGYAIVCAVYPITDCSKCTKDGKPQGQIDAPSIFTLGRRKWRVCPRCKGAKSVNRIGRRIYNWIGVTTKEGK